MTSNLKSTFAIAICFAVLIGGCCTQHSIDFNSLNGELLHQIENKNVDDETLLECISRLGKIGEPASFWTGIANDKSYSIKHRTRCVMALFRRHVDPSFGLQHLAKTLAPTRWLRDEDISVMGALAGRIPVQIGLDRTVFVISVLHDSKSAVYISVLGEMKRDEFSRIIRGSDSTENAVILEYGFNDDYDDWLKSKEK
jgi:hypothetical protein